MRHRVLAENSVEILLRQRDWDPGQGSQIGIETCWRSLPDEAFVNARFDAKQLKLLNEARNWLKAVTLADVVTADGRTFLPGIKRGERSSQQLHNYSWPRQPDKLTKALGTSGKKL